MSYIAENLLLRGRIGIKLTNLCLSNASTTDNGVNSLCKAYLVGNDKLQKLRLDLNEAITVVGAKALSEMLKMNNEK